MIVLEVVSTVLVTLGLLFLVISTVGLLRLPDAYTRSHAVAASETIGLALVIVGLLFRPELDLAGGMRLVFIVIFGLIANPTAVHALLRAARRSGLEAWRRPDASTRHSRGGPR